ncbi:MAG: integration host factor, actinobacterial type [bacterium]|nr:integration host factor, actinobacterial type [bacterium]MCY4163743.1 integration host factor, actinobacterial type [bacterium]MCY4257807.1 integration host factor, actinobacterial type [bacterium]
MPAPPPLTDEQRKAALAKASEVRRVRAELKAKLKMRTITLPEVFAMAKSDEIVAGTKILAVLESLPGMGKVRARRMMEEIGISESRRIRGLGQQQRTALLKRCAS